jgi:hypothetical protein
MSETVWVAIIGATGTIIAALLGFLANRKVKQKKEQAEAELTFQHAALSFTDFLGEWSEIEKELESLVSNTCIDRFLILRAWNGHSTPRWTTAVYQYRQGVQEPMSYIHFELDNDYIARLAAIVGRGSIAFTVDEIPDSAVKRVYEAEKVKHSAWFFISKKELTKSPDCMAITYCSFATHQEEKIPQETLTRCRILVSRMKGLTQQEVG